MIRRFEVSALLSKGPVLLGRGNVTADFQGKIVNKQSKGNFLLESLIDVECLMFCGLLL